ncbi:MAG: FHA domain-containing protein [Labilithrix sp.]|nr:FHA domain-containing protein [Labilithrix sp.]
MVSLVMNPGLPEEQQFTLPHGTVTIGRTKDNAVYCLHKSLSRKHAQVDFDGVTVKITDLQSKNGVYVNGKRVTRGELIEGDSFRCGDITFLVERATTAASTKVSNQGAYRPQDRAAQTLPSPLVIDPGVSRRPAPAGPNVTLADDQRYKDKLFLLIRASELCVSELAIDRILDDLIALAVQVLDVDRIALLALDDVTLDMRPRVIKTFVAPHQYPYSTRVVDWVVDHGSPTSFADVSRDRTLPGELARDASVRGAMCVPINPGGGTIGVIYADSLSRADCFRPDDLALLRALANLAAVAIESAALRSGELHTVRSR